MNTSAKIADATMRVEITHSKALKMRSLALMRVKTYTIMPGTMSSVPSSTNCSSAAYSSHSE